MEPVPYDQDSVEAIWTSHGAVCLDHPRLGPDVRERIREACPGVVLESCAPLLESWREHGDVLSSNP